MKVMKEIKKNNLNSSKQNIINNENEISRLTKQISKLEYFKKDVSSFSTKFTNFVRLRKIRKSSLIWKRKYPCLRLNLPTQLWRGKEVRFRTVSRPKTCLTLIWRGLRSSALRTSNLDLPKPSSHKITKPQVSHLITIEKINDLKADLSSQNLRRKWINLSSNSRARKE